MASHPHAEILDTLDTDSIINDALSLMLSTVSADVAAWISVGQVGHKRVVRQAAYLSGDPLNLDVTQMKGRPFWAGSVFDDDHELIAQRRAHWSITSPLPHQLNKFAMFSDDYLTDQIQNIQQNGSSLSIYQSFYGPLEIYNQLRALVYQGDRALGWLGICRRGAHARFRPAEQAALSAQISRLNARLSVVESQSSYGAVDDIEHVILDHALRLSWATQAASRWMTPRRLEMVRAHMRAPRQDRPHQLCVDGVWMAIVTLALPGHGHEHLVTLAPTRSIRLSPLYGLEPEAIEVAQLLVRGFSVSQIGRHLGIPERRTRAQMRRLSRHFNAEDQVQLAMSIATALRLCEPTDEPSSLASLNP